MTVIDEVLRAEAEATERIANAKESAAKQVAAARIACDDAVSDAYRQTKEENQVKLAAHATEVAQKVDAISAEATATVAEVEKTFTAKADTIKAKIKQLLTA